MDAPSKVGDENAVSKTEEEVLGLEVSMYDIFRVAVLRQERKKEGKKAGQRPKSLRRQRKGQARNTTPTLIADITCRM